MRSFENKSDQEFDATLARALERVDAPQDFAARVMATAEKQPKAKVLLFPRQRPWMSGAAAAAVLMGCFAGQHAYQEHKRAVTEKQFETAMRITDHALDTTQAQLAKAGLQF